ncbi:MAG: glycosyltransferase family 2 protein [Desulfobacca sp.]|uniref:glycosyltransferase family 2 protein n=1 Tax=Desulfobacca sp. TaxID=2067990 RepID=UPI00404B37A8
MRAGSTVGVVIPALNEEAVIGQVVAAIPAWVDEVVVVDNGSTDATAAVAQEQGARVIQEPQRGYGAACLAGIAALPDPDIIVFMDGDGSDVPKEMDFLVDPLIQDKAELVIGSRVLGIRESGALSPQVRFGNWLACWLIHLCWGQSYTDLGPFRAIRRQSLLCLAMQDRDYGWTVEMQIKAVSRGLKIIEVPVSYRRRVGTSKISGTLRGVMGAGIKILYVIFREALASVLSGKTAGKAGSCRQG